MAVMLTLVSCGGENGSLSNGGGGSAPTIASVSVSCSSSTIQVSQSSKCSAAVSGTGSFDSSVSWSVDNGMIDQNGNYTAPNSPTTAIVKATSKQDLSKNGTAVITVQVAPTIASVSVSCNPITVTEGRTAQCSATVQGAGSFDATVTWTATIGSLVSTGKDNATYTAPSGTTGTDVATATSTQDPTKSGRTAINVVIPPPTAAFQISGPGGGNLISLVADSSSPKTLYASAYGAGLYKSSDGGATWQNICANFLPNSLCMSVDEIAVSATSGTVYVRSLSFPNIPGRVFKTADGGKTWMELSTLPGSSSLLVSQIVLDPLNDSTVYVVDTQNGLYKSLDGGTTWAIEALPASCTGSLLHDSATDGKLYFGSSCSGLYVSKDFGNTWSVLSTVDLSMANSNSAAANRSLFVQASGNPQRIYANGENTVAAFEAYLYTSMDSGATWTTLFSGRALNGLVVHPTNPNEVFLGLGSAIIGGILYQGFVKTSDGGKTWTQLGYPALPGTIGQLVLTSASPEVFVGIGGSHIWQTQNEGSSWTQSDQGLIANYGYQVAVDPITPTSVYLAAAGVSGISKSSDSGKTWKNVLAGSAQSIDIDPFDPSHILAGGLWGAGTPGSPLMASNDGGTTWQQNSSPAAAGNSNPTIIVFDPKIKNTIYLGFGMGVNSQLGIAKSIDGGASWSFTNTGLSNSALTILSLAIDPANSQILIAGTIPGLYKSADGGVTWALKDSSQTPNSIVFDKNHAGYVYASGSSGSFPLRKSTDHGETWTNVSLGRSDELPTFMLAVDPKSADTIFLIPPNGPAVGWSPDGGGTWSWLSSGPAVLDGVPVISETTPETLFIPSSTVGIVSLTLQH